MGQIVQAEAPEDALIAPFAAKDVHYVDAFHTMVSGHVTLQEFIEVFYMTPLFRAERLVLRIAAKRPSTDADVRALAAGETTRFAAWDVEARQADEILLADLSGRTKSWLSVERVDAGTRLWFGSVVVPVEVRGTLKLGPVFDTLLGAHKLYSRLLLSSAARRLGSSRSTERASQN